MSVRTVTTSVLCLLSLGVQGAQPEFLRSSASVFAHPHDLSLNPKGTLLYVADLQHDVVQVLDPDSLAMAGKIGVDELSSPHDVAFDAQGRLYVADSGNDRIVVYDVKDDEHGVKATFITALSDSLASPEGVAPGADGSVYVASTGNHSIVQFKDEQRVKQIGRRGSGRDEFIRPHDIELGPDGLLYIGDPGNNRIQVYSTALEYHHTIQDKQQPYNEPKYLALDTNNRLYIADQHNNRLRILSRERQPLALIKQAGSQELNYPEGVEVSGNRLWIADTYNNRIVLFKLE